MTQGVRGNPKGPQLVRDVMERCAKLVAPMVKAADALAQMQDEQLHHLIVYSGKTVLGIVSVKDLTEATLGLKPIGAFVTQRPPIATPSMTLLEAIELMRGRTVGILPVLEKGQLLGCVTVAGALHALHGTFEGRERRPPGKRAERAG